MYSWNQQDVPFEATCILHPSPATLQGNKEWEHNTVHGAAGRTGRVLALQPSPFLQDVLLAVGDCGFAVWRVQCRGSSTGRGGAGGGSGGAEVDSGVEGSTADGSSEALLPIFESRFPHALYSCGCWSPSKPGGLECAAILPQWIGAAVLLVMVVAAAIPSLASRVSRDSTVLPSRCCFCSDELQVWSSWDGRTGGWRPGICWITPTSPAWWPR